MSLRSQNNDDSVSEAFDDENVPERMNRIEEQKESLKQTSQNIQERMLQEVDPMRLYKQGGRATREDFVDRSQEEGSLWASSGQTNYYFTKNKIRSPGDIITLIVEEELYREVGKEYKQSLTPQEQAYETHLLQEQVKEKLLGQGALNKDNLVASSAAPQRTSGTTPQPQPSAAPSGTNDANSGNLPHVTNPSDAEKIASKLTYEDVDIYQSLEFKPGDKMMGEIAQRYANGNYLIKGTKRIPHKRGETRMVEVLGIVKAADITEETDIVNSGKLYEHRIGIAN